MIKKLFFILLLTSFVFSQSTGGAGNANTWTFPGNVTATSDYLLEGYTTGRNVLRSIKIIITGHTDADKCTFQTIDLFNGEAWGSELLTEGTPGTNLSLDGTGTALTITGAGGTPKTVQKIISASIHSIGTGTWVSPAAAVAGNLIEVQSFDINKAQVVFSDIANTKVIEFYIVYVTSD